MKPPQTATGARALGEAVKAARRAATPAAVHDVRVATRRLMVALGVEVADEAGEPARGERALRKLMRACGRVRDRDVAAELVAVLAPHVPTLERLERQRRKSARELRARLGRWVKAKRWKSFAQALERASPDTAEDAPGKAGLSALVARGHALFAAPLDQAALHALRLELKHTRYAFERAPGDGPADGARLQALRDLQDALGQVTDVARTLELLRGKAPARVTRALEAERLLRYRAAADAWRRETPLLGVGRPAAASRGTSRATVRANRSAPSPGATNRDGSTSRPARTRSTADLRPVDEAWGRAHTAPGSGVSAVY